MCIYILLYYTLYHTLNFILKFDLIYIYIMYVFICLLDILFQQISTIIYLWIINYILYILYFTSYINNSYYILFIVHSILFIIHCIYLSYLFNLLLLCIALFCIVLYYPPLGLEPSGTPFWPKWHHLSPAAIHDLRVASVLTAPAARGRSPWRNALDTPGEASLGSLLCLLIIESVPIYIYTHAYIDKYHQKAGDDCWIHFGRTGFYIFYRLEIPEALLLTVASCASTGRFSDWSCGTDRVHGQHPRERTKIDILLGSFHIIVGGAWWYCPSVSEKNNLKKREWRPDMISYILSLVETHLVISYIHNIVISYHTYHTHILSSTVDGTAARRGFHLSCLSLQLRWSSRNSHL